MVNGETQSNRSMSTAKEHSFPYRAWQHVRLVRPFSLIGSTGEVALGAHLSGYRVHWHSIVAASIAVSFILGFAQAYNDLRDEDNDRRANKDRPIARGYVSTRFAWSVALTMVTIGLLTLAFVASLVAALIALSLAILAGTYSDYFKRIIYLGNLIAAGLSSAPVLFGAYLVGGVTPVCVITFVFFWVFLINYEIIKSIRDVREDAIAGIQSVATQISNIWLRGLLWVHAAPVLAAPLIGIFCAPEATIQFAAIVVVGVSLPTVMALIFVTRSGFSSQNSINWSVKSMQITWFPALIAFSLLSYPTHW